MCRLCRPGTEIRTNESKNFFHFTPSPLFFLRAGPRAPENRRPPWKSKEAEGSTAPASVGQPLHSTHWAVGRVFTRPALSGHGADTGGTMQLYCRQRELLMGISAVGFICIPVK